MKREFWRRSSLLMILPVLAFCGFALFLGRESPITPDSVSYMYFGDDRPVGYPLFLALVRSVTGGFVLAPYVQLGVLCLSLGFLVWSFRVRTGSLMAALALEALLFANPGLMMLSGQILSDCLSAACLALFAAIIILMSDKPRGWMISSLAVITAMAVSIRPVNLALVPAGIAAILVYGRELRPSRFAQMLVLVLCVAAGQGLTPLVHAIRQDHAQISNPLARGLLQKTLFRPWPSDAQADACDGALIARDTALADAYLADVPANIRKHLLQSYSSYLRFNVIIPDMENAHDVSSAASVDAILMCYDKSRIKADPLFFVQDAAHQFWDLLTYSTFLSQEERAAVEQYLAQHPPVAPPSVVRRDADFLLRQKAVAEMKLDPSVFIEGDVRLDAPRARPRLPTYGLRIFQVGGALAMLAGVFAVLWRLARRRARSFGDLDLLGVLGLAFYAEMLLTSIVEIAVPRYVFPLWPLFCVALVLVSVRVIGLFNKEEVHCS